MLVTNHVLSGALIGYAAPNAPVAFVAGVVSHFAVDAVPHWGENRPLSELLHVAVTDGLLGLAVMGLATVAAPVDSRVPVLAGMAGAAFPDLDKPSTLFFGSSPFPEAWDAFHQRLQREAPHRMPQEVLVGIAGAMAVAAVSRSVRRRRTG
jgi:hypothetical protein